MYTTYKTYVRPAIKYCWKLLVIALDTLHNKPEILQNNAFRIITDSAYSMPTEAMQLLTN